MNSFSAGGGCSLKISGGTVTIDAAGDGLDSNGSLEVSGGEVYVSGPTNSANGAFDYDSTGVISGGIVVAAGSSGMAQNFDSSSKQGSILVKTQSAQSAGTKITLTDSSGKLLVSYSPTKQFNSVVVSAPGITVGGKCTLTAGSESYTIEMASIIYGSGGGMGFGGGFGGDAQGQDRPDMPGNSGNTTHGGFDGGSPPTGDSGAGEPIKP